MPSVGDAGIVTVTALEDVLTFTHARPVKRMFVLVAVKDGSV
jgi:hypothetical protein